MSLRDYQAAAALGIEEQWEAHTSTMAVLPTGTGKTVLFAEMIRRRRAAGRAMVIAHREELIWQAEEKIRKFAGLACGIEMGERTASSTFFDDGQDVVLASVQSLISGRTQRRMERFKPAEFATIIIDEFHHATAASYRAVLDYFLRGNPGIKVLGGKYSEEVRALAETIIERDGRRYIEGALEEAEQELAEERREAAERRRQQEEARKARLVAKATYSARGVNPFDAFDVRPVADDRAYDGKALSEKQRSILIKMGIDPDALSYRNGKGIIDEQFRRWELGLCTAKQAAVLNKFGYDGAKTTMADARRLIDAIAANGWRRPAGPPRGPVVSKQ